MGIFSFKRGCISTLYPHIILLLIFIDYLCQLDHYLDSLIMFPKLSEWQVRKSTRNPPAFLGLSFKYSILSRSTEIKNSCDLVEYPLVCT